MSLLLICTGVIGLVFIALMVQLIRHRVRHAGEKHFHETWMSELAWALVPFLLLALLMWPLFK